MNCTDARLDLGVYVVGALDPAERAVLDGHLTGCPGCRDELARLAGLPGLLSRLDPDEAAAGPVGPPADLFDRIAARAARDERTARRRRLVGVAAAVAVLAGVGLGVGLAGGSRLARPPSVTVAAVDRTTGVSGRAQLTASASGTVIALRVAHVHPGEHCWILAVARDGTRDVAGTWVATYDGTAAVHGVTDIPRNQLAALDVETTSGRLLLALPVS